MENSIAVLDKYKEIIAGRIFLILENWLDKCDILRPISNKSKLIKDNLKYLKNYKPISLDKLKNENNELYNIIKNQ